MIPVPGYGVGTPYGRRGPYWSCDADASGNGIHTGVDYPAAVGTRVAAARGGKVVYCNHGSAFGNHQLEIVPGDGTRDFYAHMTTRTPADGSHVDAGATVGKVGAEGNVTGPHLHFERHSVPSGPWSCGVIRDPAPSINYESSGSGGSGAGGGEDDDVPTYTHGAHTKHVKLTDGNWYVIDWEDSNPDYFDGAGIKIGGAKFDACLSVHVTDRGGATVQTSWVEFGDGEAQETYATAVHGPYDHCVDARNGLCQDGRRLRARVRTTGGNGTLERTDVTVLFWP